MTNERQMPIYINALAYELGETPRSLESLATVPDDIREQLREGALDTYRVSTRTPLDLARVPMERSLEALTAQERVMVRRVIVATNSFHDSAITEAAAVSRMLVELDIAHVTPIGLFLSFCANVQSAIAIARGLISIEGDGSILVVCSDVRSSEADRLVAPNISVLSDAAMSFVVSSSDGPYRVLDSRLCVDSVLGGLDREQHFLTYMDGVARNVTSVVGDVLRGLDLTPDDIACVCPNNYNKWVCRSMAELAGFPEERLYLENIPRFAHAFAADNVINLVDLSRAGGVSPGDLVALFGTGAFQWGCTVVEAA
jgi:3-oxoacyl-[acyl-carrier-protein] synthase III